MTMRLRSVVSEALRNVGTRSSRPLLSFALFAIVVGALALFDLFGIKAILSESRAFLNSGAAISIISAPGEIDGAACDNLNSLSGVNAAGAIAESVPIRFLALPSSAVPVKRVSPGFVELLATRSDSSVAGLYLSSELARALAVNVGDPVQTAPGTASVAGVYDYPDDGRAPGLGWAVLVVEPAAGMFDACWESVPNAVSTGGDYLLTTVSENPTESPTFGQLNTTLGKKFDARHEFINRPSSMVVVAAGAFGLMLGFGSKRVRRLELASALHVGVTKSALVVQVVIEEAVWLVAANAVVLGAAGWVIQSELDVDALVVFANGLRTAFSATACVFIGAAASVFMTQEKDLFRYFKAR
ncbi:hypothetical protein [Cryobacterium shii]|uniref:Uncharacterized protein n=1 Tax=Cryobacterium shii TaxID=1259235 RepID=A0AAQ2C6R6_9MICO|nr:hypothetical protein [Cryobacterium shii]TFC48920.1 hypothetical protein E3O49_06840 [Cryobacterium shii]